MKPSILWGFFSIKISSVYISSISVISKGPYPINSGNILPNPGDIFNFCSSNCCFNLPKVNVYCWLLCLN